jgi:lysophospholipase L1-like esterase
MGFVSKRGRFVLLRGRKADIMHELLYFLFQLLMVVVVLIALIQYTNNVAKDLGFEKRFTSNDMALFTTAVTYAPGTLKQVYDPIIFKVAVDAGFANSIVSITEKGSKLAPVVFWFLSDRNLEVMRGEASLKAATQDSSDTSSASGYISPNVTYFRTGGSVSLSEKENNALRMVCPTVDTFASDWKSKKVFIAKVLPDAKQYSDNKLPVNRLANALSTRYSQVSLSGAVKDASSQDSKLISAIPSNVELIIAIGDSGEKREKGSLVAYIPVDGNIMKARKFACFIVNDLLTPETTVYYAQVMPIFPASINKTSPLRVFKEVSDTKQVIVFLDISTFSESQISIENTADAIYRAIERYYGGYDVKAVSGATFSYSGGSEASSATTLQPAGSSSSAAAVTSSAGAQASSSVSSVSCPARIVAVGDSLTAGSSYVSYLRKLCGSSTKIMNEDGDSSTSQVWKEIKAGGKPRDRIAHESKITQWMLEDFDTALSSELNADMIIVFGGGNDVASSRSYASITSNLEAMYSKARAAGKKVVAVTMIRGPGATVAAQLDTKKRVNQWILTQSGADIKVNTYDLFVAPGSDTGNAAYFGSDLSHPNALGKEVIAKAVFAAITGNSQQSSSVAGASSTASDGTRLTPELKSAGAKT